MKKLIMMATLAVAVIGGASAQKRISFRADAAVGFSAGDYKIESFGDFAGKTIVGYRFSGNIEVPLSSGLYVSPGLAFQSKGTKTDLAGLGLKSLKLQTHYVEIPVHLGYRINLLNLLSVAVQAGPYFSYAIQSNATGTNANGSTVDIYQEGLS